LNNDIVYGGHDKLDLFGISGARKVCVDLLSVGLVKRDKSVEDVGTSLLISVGTFEIRKVVCERGMWQFFLETINFVQEQDDGSLDKPSRVANGVEQR
jgi:hypothetical protein